MSIRQATISDAASIAETHVLAWRTAYRGQIPAAILDALDVAQRADVWRRILSVEHGVFVAVRDAVVVAFCSFTASRDEDATPTRVAEITALYVCPRHWRCGIARSLCSHTFEAAITAGFSTITVWVLASNRTAITFYEATGFARDGATRRTASDFTYEELRMRRALEKGRNA